MASDQSEYPADWRDELGLVGVGGGLTPARVLSAYANGIFPWPLLGERGPVLWCSPDPRFVLYLDQFHLPRSLARTLRRRVYAVRFDTAFEEVIRSCARISRPGQRSSWITEPLIQTYLELYRLGWAHSVESYRDGQLLGGLYGVALGGAFFGESMFARSADASKVAFARLVSRLRGWRFRLVDCQQETPHLKRFGARPVARQRFLEELAACLGDDNRRGSWRDDDASPRVQAMDRS